MSVHGIDLGTTYCCIAKLDANGNAQVIPNQLDSSDSLASALYFETPENIIIGQSAKEYIETDGQNVAQFFKRDIGNDEAPKRVIHGKEYTPLELSSILLKRIKEMAEEQGEEVNDVIITCPASFGFVEREITKEAGKNAGLNVLNLVNEPTAAALNYCAKSFTEEKNILVYDLGGGTFDVTLIKMSVDQNEQGEDVQQVRIVATGGKESLGGKDWDDALFTKIRNAVCDELGLSPSDLDADAIQNIRSKVETTKKKLTHAEKATVKVTVEGQMVKINVTREEFENLTKGLVDETMVYVDGTLEKAKKVEGTDISIDKVLLVGGSTNMPMIKAAVEARFPGLVQVEDPSQAVAKGAAIYAGLIVEEKKKEIDPTDDTTDPVDPEKKDEDEQTGPQGVTSKIGTVIDVAPRSFGPAIYFNESGKNVYLIDNLVKEGQEINKKIEKTYYTMVDNQAKIRFTVYESRSVDDTVIPCFLPDDNTGEDTVPQDTDPTLAVKKLGELVLNLTGHEPKGTPVYVEFTVEPKGIVIKSTLSTDLSITNEEFIKYDTGISEEEMEEIRRNVERVTVTSE